MHTAKRPALRRFWMIDRELRTRSYPSTERLAEIAGVDKKTILLDLKSLRDDHLAPAKYDQQHGGWYYTCETYRLPAVIISEGELVAMFLAGQALQQAVGTGYEAELRQAIQKLSQFLPDEVTLHWRAFEQTQSFRQSATTLHDLKIFQQLTQSTLDQRRMKIRYWTASRNVEELREVDPYHLACVDSTWYLLGWCHTRQEIRTFAVSRVREATETGHEFHRPTEFQIGDYFKGTFKVVAEKDRPLETIRLKFAPSAAKYVRERIYHESQSVEVHSDQSITLTMTLQSFIEVRRWVLSWGSECEVLEPPELRDDIHREAKRMIQQVASQVDQAADSAAASLERIRAVVKPPPRRQNRTG